MANEVHQPLVVVVDPLAGPSATATYAIALITATTAVHAVFGAKAAPNGDGDTWDWLYTVYLICNVTALLEGVCILAVDASMFILKKSSRSLVWLVRFRNFLWWTALNVAAAGFISLSFYHNHNQKKNTVGKWLTWAGSIVVGVIYGCMNVVLFTDRCGDKLIAWSQAAWTTIGAWLQGAGTAIGALFQAVGAWFGAEGCITQGLNACMGLCGNNGNVNGAELGDMV